MPWLVALFAGASLVNNATDKFNEDMKKKKQNEMILLAAAGFAIYYLSKN